MLLERPVEFAEDCVGQAARDAVQRAAAGSQVVLLENLRFHPEEEKNDPAFARRARGAGRCLRERRLRVERTGRTRRWRPSPRSLPRAAAGFLMEKELDVPRPRAGVARAAVRRDPRRRQGLRQDRGHREPARPGRRARSLAARWPTRSSRRAGFPSASRWSRTTSWTPRGRSTAAASERDVRLQLPVDHVVAPKIEPGAAHETLAIDDPAIGDCMGLDIGPKTIEAYRIAGRRREDRHLERPDGRVRDRRPSPKGTIAVAQAVATVHGTTIIGGGDSMCGRSPRRALPTRSRTSRPAAARRSSSSAAAMLPGVEALADR